MDSNVHPVVSMPLQCRRVRDRALPSFFFLHGPVRGGLSFFFVPLRFSQPPKSASFVSLLFRYAAAYLWCPRRRSFRSLLVNFLP